MSKDAGATIAEKHTPRGSANGGKDEGQNRPPKRASK